MINKDRLCGMGVAVVTPFKSNDEIDYEALANLIDMLISGGADFLVAMGTTAETPTLHPDERLQLLDFFRDKVSGRIPIVAGIGSNCTEEIVTLLGKVNLKGYDAILSVVPFYNKPSQIGMEKHFRAIADASPVPVILYNVPGRTGVNMDASTTLRLAEHENIIAIKEASGNFRQIEEIIEKRPEGFLVLSGDDGITFPLMKLGADGVISVLGNCCPKMFGEMVTSCREGDYDRANEIHEKFSNLYVQLFQEGNPAGVKAALAAMGVISNNLRLPLVPVSDQLYSEIKEEIGKL